MRGVLGWRTQSRAVRPLFPPESGRTAKKFCSRPAFFPKKDCNVENEMV